VLVEAIAAARQAGATVAFDPNYRPRLWASPESARAAIGAALAVSDIALPTFPDEQALFGDQRPAETAARLIAVGVGEIVVKDGADPALAVWDGGRAEIPAVHVADPVDTTGAGDSFNGAYLAARLAGDTPDVAVRRAHAAAAAVVRVRGALAPYAVLREAYEAAVTAA
jgi:2-dehydro-3-deoxygluconokinase